MTKQEILKAIENGESVWVVFNEYSYKNDSIKEIDWTKVEGVELHNNYFQYFNGENLCGHYYELIFKTKVKAEHYLNHANVTRTEQLPFLTWEEFLEDKNFEFFDKNGILTWLYINTSKTSESIHLNNRFEKLNDWELTEENFYKAYDECVRLFKGGGG